MYRLLGMIEMSSYICCYNQETRELEHYKVPEAVYVYVKQLECEIKYNSGGVQKLYPFRFKEQQKLIGL